MSTQPEETLAVLADRLGREQVFGEPVERESATLVPVLRIRSGRGRGGVTARAAGAFAIGRDGKVAWHPAVDVNRIVWGGQLALVAIAVAVATATGKRRKNR
ncbi:hypothetical protein [Pseudonocardia sp.]|jgi:hypothetical protein|uniref:hypothetical protein n=1 Tax=Pseudonocardia sp. TaxID=60912 RepID=UPI002625C968|nr:hypothetical protein [Pseudonocardia sp.]MCU1630883.1 hypothetical protein [Pseudonocardia sp.]MDT7700221.1 hypothetical protein [Pseudonocardiales bacterium]HEV7469877.1 hypothetical protein [Pseudonocardia sp.]